jgi:putative tryptophan/tyrosine transport system substrate-binding protein
MAINIARRKFISVVGSAALCWPLAARAQQRTRRVGVLMNLAADNPTGQARLARLLLGLREAGWVDGRNVQIDARWAAGDAEGFHKCATELIALESDVILAVTTPAVTALQQASRTVPIVFVAVIDPVGSGLVASLARPGGNATGFVTFEYALAAKWLQLLKEIAPDVMRVAVLREVTSAAGIGQFAAIQAVGSMGLELSAINMRDVGEIERAVDTFTHGSKGGLIVTASGFGANHPDAITALAARHKLPAVYPFRYFVRSGGLISYGPDLTDEFGLAAGYVDRVLKGEEPANLPVQAPTKYELAVNLKTAMAIDVAVPGTILARADEVIE